MLALAASLESIAAYLGIRLEVMVLVISLYMFVFIVCLTSMWKNLLMRII